MTIHPDFEELLKLLEGHKVDYMIVGYRTRILSVFQLLAVGVFLVGCGPKQTPKTNAPDPQGAAEPVVTEVSTNSAGESLQSVINRVTRFPYLHNQDMRPLLLSQRRENRRDWILQVLEDGYRRNGKTNQAWDARVLATFEAYADYSRAGTTNWPSFAAALDAVSKTECDDPVIRYMIVRYDVSPRTELETAKRHLRVHDAVLQSQHHPSLKFLIGVRADKTVNAVGQKVDRSERIKRITVSLQDFIRDTNAPVTEVFRAVRAWLTHSYGKPWDNYIARTLDTALVQNWGATEPFHRFQGELSIRRAWGARTGGWARNVTKKGWAYFGAHLKSADEHLSKAWELDPTKVDTAYMMMQVELGQGRGRPRMEMWFQRAMALSPNYYAPASLMSFYLQPRWYGSREETLKFARSCVASDEWGGRVPLVLADVHRSLAKFSGQEDSPAYWQRPGVWRDIKSSYEKFFDLNPNGVGTRHPYAKDAFDCGKYEVFLEQTRLFIYGTNHAAFGGVEKFQEMIETATEATSAK